MSPVLFPRSDEGLHPDEVTIADMLKDAGYRTACVGKWHLGHLPPCLPTYQGFESYYGIPYSNDMWRDPANTVAKDVVLREGLTIKEVTSGYREKNKVPLMRDEEIIEYPVDRNTITKKYTEEAIAFIKTCKDEPFFLYLPHTMVHRPLHVSEAFAKTEGTGDALIHDAIEEIDWSVGEVLKAVKEAGIDENTLVIFTSDNGAAVGSSLPLRSKKGSVYDGGIREPTVMRWPGHIPAGERCTEVAATIDLLPTFARLCGGKLPKNKIDGHNIWPLMSGKKDARSPHKEYVLMHGPGTVRSGKWKFYPWQEGKSGSRRDAPPRGRKLSPLPVQLYDTDADIGETTNLAEKHPQIVATLAKAYEQHVADIQANKRPTAIMIRPEGALSAELPGRAKRPRAQKN